MEIMTCKICQTQKDKYNIISHTWILDSNFIHMHVYVMEQKGGSEKGKESLRWRREGDRILCHDS